jgi:hypothetical protein
LSAVTKIESFIWLNGTLGYIGGTPLFPILDTVLKLPNTNFSNIGTLGSWSVLSEELNKSVKLHSANKYFSPLVTTYSLLEQSQIENNKNETQFVKQTDNSMSLSLQLFTPSHMYNSCFIDTFSSLFLSLGSNNKHNFNYYNQLKLFFRTLPIFNSLFFESFIVKTNQESTPVSFEDNTLTPSNTFRTSPFFLEKESNTEFKTMVSNDLLITFNTFINDTDLNISSQELKTLFMEKTNKVYSPIIDEFKNVTRTDALHFLMIQRICFSILCDSNSDVIKLKTSSLKQRTNLPIYISFG